MFIKSLLFVGCSVTVGPLLVLPALTRKIYLNSNNTHFFFVFSDEKKQNEQARRLLNDKANKSSLLSFTNFDINIVLLYAVFPQAKPLLYCSNINKPQGNFDKHFPFTLTNFQLSLLGNRNF